MLLSCLLVPDTHICSRCVLCSAVICLDSRAPYCLCGFGLNPHVLVLSGSRQFAFPGSSALCLRAHSHHLPASSAALEHTQRKVVRWVAGEEACSGLEPVAVPVCSRLREEGCVSGAGSLTVATWSLDFGVEWGQKRSECWALSAFKRPLPCFLHCADPGGAKGPALI